MNIKEVPQDDEGFLKAGKIRDLCYAIDEEGNYKQVLSLGWEPKNEAMKQAWNVIKENTEKTKQEIILGKISNLAYFIEKNAMTVKILAKYSGISVWRVKKHLKPKVFNNLKPSVLQKYAEVFKISTEELTKSLSNQ